MQACALQLSLTIRVCCEATCPWHTQSRAKALALRRKPVDVALQRFPIALEAHHVLRARQWCTSEQHHRRC